jgi:hypothetical protein
MILTFTYFFNNNSLPGLYIFIGHGGEIIPKTALSVKTGNWPYPYQKRATGAGFDISGLHMQNENIKT